MVKIVTNVSRQDVTQSFTAGQTFPKVEGKLISIEVSGKELTLLQTKVEIPLSVVDNVSIMWHGKHAGHVLKLLRELFGG